jgi:glycosyltransferase involved in cell wall biosynthesis
MKKLNILIVCDSITDHVAGAFISPLRFAELLKKRGHKVVFIASKFPNTPATDYYKKIKVYRFRSIPLPKFPFIRLAFPTKREIGRIIKNEKIDIVYTIIPTLASLSSIKSARKNLVKIVSHSHTQPENIILNFPSFMRIKSLNTWVYKCLIWLYGKAEVTICPSKFAERALKKYNPYLKTIVISNGVDLYRFKKLNSEHFIKKFNLNKKSSIILYVGRLDPEKSIDTLIKSMEKVLKDYPNAFLGIVGRGSLGDSLEKLARNLGLEKNIKFFGKISDADLVQAYNASDIFVLPSLAELEGMTVLEAMACGKPILIANSKESASVDLVQGNGFLFESGNSEDLSKKILKLLKNSALRKKMGQKSFELAKNYDINRSIDKLEEVYYSLLK